MELSKYIKVFPYAEKPGYLLFYSTKRSASILLREPIVKSIEEGTLSASNQETLSNLGFLVTNAEAEKQNMRNYIEEINKRNKRFSAIVVLNLDCNMACRYCFEDGIKNRQYMSPDTAQKIIEYCEKYPLSSGKSVTLYFYGGEPLLSYDMIQSISKTLKRVLSERGFEYSFNIVSNGTLLSRKKIEELVALGLKEVQITIDGPRENHNYYRPFQSGEGTFDVIINNIKETFDLITIRLGGNYTMDNYKSFPLLLDYLLQEGITPEKISSIGFYPVAKPKGHFGLSDHTMGCESISEPWLFEASVFLREEILKRGFFTDKLAPALCMVELQDDLVINFDGAIYKCPGFLGIKNFEVGNIREGIHNYQKSHNLDIWKREECLNCAYLPLCFGGCRYITALRTDSCDTVCCRKPYFDAVLECLVKQEIRYNLKSTKPTCKE